MGQLGFVPKQFSPGGVRREKFRVDSEDNQWRVIVIPASAQVTLVEGDLEQDRFVKIRYPGKVVLILSEDLRRGIGLANL